MLVNLLKKNALKRKFFFLGEKGNCLMKTDANILFCDLTLKPGESKTCKPIRLSLRPVDEQVVLIHVGFLFYSAHHLLGKLRP